MGANDHSQHFRPCSYVSVYPNVVARHRAQRSFCTIQKCLHPLVCYSMYYVWDLILRYVRQLGSNSLGPYSKQVPETHWGYNCYYKCYDIKTLTKLHFLVKSNQFQIESINHGPPKIRDNLVGTVNQSTSPRLSFDRRIRYPQS